MDSVTWDVILVLLAGTAWLAAAIWQAHNIRRQERMISWLWGVALRRPPEAAPGAPARDAVAEPDPPHETLNEHLRATNRWTAG
jgi:hypothetical protein